MIYCQISTRIAHEGGGKWRGDVLIAKSEPIYSIEEHRQALIVEIEDELLELEIFNTPTDSTVQIRVHPYAEYETDESGEVPNDVMILRSRKYIDIASMPEALQESILNPDEIIPMMTWDEISAYWATRSEDQF